MADLTVRVNANTGDAERGLASVTRHLAIMRAIAGSGALASAKGLGIANLGTVALASAAQVSSMAVALSSVALAAIPLPGLLAGAAVGGIGLGLALKDAKTQLAGLGPEFAKVQQAASAGFWKESKEYITSLATAALPQLRSGLGLVGTAWGQFAAVASFALERSLTSGAGLAPLFTAVATSIDMVKLQVGPLVEAFAAIGAVGVSYIVPLTSYLSGLAGKFADFVNRAAASGQLAAWAQTGVTALGQLLQIMGQVGGIVVTLISTMSQFGGAGSLTPLLAGVTALNQALSGPLGQNLLGQVFGAAQTAMQALAPAFGSLGSILQSLVPVLAAVLPTAAGVTSTLLGALAPLVSQLAAAIVPVVPLIGQVLTQAVAALAPVLTQVIAALGPLLPMIGQVLLQAVQAVAPLLASLGPVFALIGQAVAALLPVVGQIVTVLGTALAPIFSALTPVMAAVVPVVQMIAGVLGEAVTALAPVLVAVGELVGILLTGLTPAITVAGSIIKTFAQVQNAVLRPALVLIAGIVSAVSAAMRGDWTGAWDIITNAARTAAVMLASSIQGGMDRVKSAVGSGIAAVTDFFAGLPGKIVSALSGLGSQLFSVGVDVIRGLMGGIQSMASSVASTARNIVSGAVSAAKSALGIHSPSRVFAEIGRYSGLGLAQGLAAMTGRVEAAGAALVGAAVPSTVPTIALTGAGSGAASVTVNVNVDGFVGNSGELARAIVAAINTEARDSGLVPVGGARL
ncbi:hypothetical protein HJ590_12120 [Naumannella sp. ID2617S]|nr:hypothetical protein [Naumannella sp. ID2617S]